MTPAEPDAQDISVLDLTAEAPDPRQSAPQLHTIDQQREDTRRTVAVSLLLGLAVVIGAWGAVGMWGDEGDIASAGDALQTAFTGVLGLTASVVGFYFGGGKSDSR